MTTTSKILLADDDEVLAEMLSEYLSSEGYEVAVAANGQQAVDMVSQSSYDLVVLDIMMPVLNGIEALKQIRQQHALPVIMLTARGDDLDRILGLELGADDYLAKPCNPRELYARIKAVLRRTGPGTQSTNHEIVLGDIRLDPNLREVTLNNISITLTQTEFDLLYLMTATPDTLLSKNQISLKVLEKPLSQWDRSIDMHISNLRKKLGNHPDGQERIRTVRGSGYLYMSQGRHS